MFLRNTLQGVLIFAKIFKNSYYNYVYSLKVRTYIFRICQHISQNSIAIPTSQRMNRKLQRRKRTNKMLIIVSVSFFISWAPINIFNSVYDLLYKTVRRLIQSKIQGIHSVLSNIDITGVYVF